METDLLIDGDLLLYRSACGVEKEVKWDEENHVLFSNWKDAWGLVQDTLKRLFDKFQTDSHVIALTGERYFRKDIYPQYKENRSGTRKPLCYYDLVDSLKSNYRTKLYEGLEADDVLGILATKPTNRHRIIVSEDKDMLSIPATVHAKGVTKTISVQEADYHHLYQTLVGDQTDNYPGCKGVGPVKAKKLLDNGGGWNEVVNAFQKSGATEEDALVQARLARILRWEDWDDQKKEPILWQPQAS